MDRRVWLGWSSRLLALACSAVVVVPGVRYIIDPLQRKSSTAQGFKRLALLEDLPFDVPKHLPVTGSLQDAWTHYDETKIGDTWLVRRSGPDVPPEEAQGRGIQYDLPPSGLRNSTRRWRQQLRLPVSLMPSLNSMATSSARRAM